MIILKALIDIGKDIKENDYIIANEGVFFFELNNHQVEMYRRGNFAYDLKSNRYVVISKAEADKLVDSANNPLETIKELEAKLKEAETNNEVLKKEVDKIDTVETKKK